MLRGSANGAKHACGVVVVVAVAEVVDGHVPHITGQFFEMTSFRISCSHLSAPNTCLQSTGSNLPLHCPSVTAVMLLVVLGSGQESHRTGQDPWYASANSTKACVHTNTGTSHSNSSSISPLHVGVVVVVVGVVVEEAVVEVVDV